MTFFKVSWHNADLDVTPIRKEALFHALKIIEERIDNPFFSKSMQATLSDLSRTPNVLLTSTPDKYRQRHVNFLFKRHHLLGDLKGFGHEVVEHQPKHQPNIYGLFKFPSKEQILQYILPFFGEIPEIQEYIVLQTNQNNYANAGRTEVVERLLAAGFLQKLAPASRNDSLEFRKLSDGSVLVFETFHLSNELYELEKNRLLSSPHDYIAKAILCTRIHLVNKKIQHDIVAFNLKPKDWLICSQLLLYSELSDLSVYVNDKGKLLKKCQTFYVGAQSADKPPVLNRFKTILQNAADSFTKSVADSFTTSADYPCENPLLHQVASEQAEMTPFKRQSAFTIN